MPPPSPTVARWELSLRLRQHRERLGIEARTVAGWLGFSPNYLSAVENDRSILAEDKLLALLDRYEVDDNDRKELLDLREVAKQRGWWADYTSILSEADLKYYGLEYGAYSMRTYEGLVIPGILQIDEYARALMRSDPAVSELSAEQYVALRMRRQDRLAGRDPLHLTVLLSEAALWQQVGGRDVQIRQLDHLIARIDEHPDSLELRVVPFSHSPGELIVSATLALLDFSSPNLPVVAYNGAFLTDVVPTADPVTVRYAASVYGQALSGSLDRTASRKLVERRRDSMD